MEGKIDIVVYNWAKERRTLDLTGNSVTNERGECPRSITPTNSRLVLGTPQWPKEIGDGMFDISRFKQAKPGNTRYERRLARLREQGIDTQFIEETVAGALKNIESGNNSFVIYGDPQSGKTEMMVALTAKLLDCGHKIIVVLSKDDIQLQNQNLDRFARSSIDPTPRSFAEVTAPNVKIGKSEWVIFCKKNSKDLEKLVSKIGDESGKVIIDDEADYATPNSKVNRDEKTRINELVGELLGDNWTYIGVTATPARLDLNNTFENANEHWVYFKPHSSYTGQDVFFPVDLNADLKFRRTLIPDQHDEPSYLRKALFGFLVNVAYLNTRINPKETNYSILIHTSGKKADMTVDYRHVIDTFSILQNLDHKNYAKYVEQLWNIAKERYKTTQVANEVTQYILQNVSRNKVVVMNSDTDRKNIDFSSATTPASMFTVAIGGNIVSRGVTFLNLLSMFFTRDAKHKIQQDTYIQRARMFGQRNDYVRYFELTIPKKLYTEWHRCFIFHRLALESARQGSAPVWLEDKRISAAAPASIDRTVVAMDSGEMSFEVFDYDDSFEHIVADVHKKPIEKLKALHRKLGDSLPEYLVSFIEKFSPLGNDSVAVHSSTDISNRGPDVDQKNISRTRGFVGQSELEKTQYPHAIHHVKIFYNKRKKARVFYKYNENVQFLKRLKEV